MKNFFKDLKKHAIKNTRQSKKKEMVALAIEKDIS